MNCREILVLIFVMLMTIGPMSSTIRKHKVHNIVLYPDKHSWCTSTVIKQVISDADCGSVEMDNRVCFGACFSYSIPRTLPANNGDVINPYCDSCQPIKTSWVPVELKCNDGSNRTKYMQLIDECKCSSCSRHWKFENPIIDAEDEQVSTQTSRYLELMKLKHDENAEGKDANTTDVSNKEILDTVNINGIVYEKNVWIKGPHHSKVLLKKETVTVPNIVSNETQHHLVENTVDKTKQ